MLNSDPFPIQTRPWFQQVIPFQYDTLEERAVKYSDLVGYFNEMYGITGNRFEFCIISAKVWGPVARGASQENRVDTGLETYSMIDLTDQEPLFVGIDYADVSRRAAIKFVWPKTHQEVALKPANASSFLRINGCELLYVTVRWRFHVENVTKR